MKKIILILILSALFFCAKSQDEKYNQNEIQTIFSKYKSNGGYGALSFGFSQIDGKDAFITGARGGFIIDHGLAIGVAGYGFVNDLNHREILTGDYTRIGLAGGYGGFFIEPIIAPRFPIHVSFPVLFGIGGIASVEDTGWYNYYYEGESDVYLVVEPSAEIELNLTKFLRAAGYLSYRYTSDITITDIDPDVLKKWNIGITFKLGKF